MIDGDSVRAFVIAALRLAGVAADAVDEETLARVLPLARAALADGPRLAHAAAARAPLEPLAYPGGPGSGA